MKVFVQIIDTKTGSSQYNMIDEPVKKGFEVANAVGHLGVDINSVDWLFNQELYKIGNVKETTKIVTVVCV